MTRKRLSREESREQTRERLLTAAAELFAERGVNGTSVEQIAERAGYTRGAFYGNFEDKHHLVLELLHRRTRRELDEVRALGEGAPSPAEALAPLRAWHRDRARHLDGWLALRMELLLYALRNKEIRPLLATREHFARDAHADGIRQAFAERGVVPPADPAFLALVVHALEDGLLIQRLLSPDDVTDEVVVDAYELLMRSWTALATRGSRPDDDQEGNTP
ncbi:transcriptional regulator, TetR family [Streptoalloteichus tenebrarius]|uniref:Transcriptional regulator, TetR family n=1 Tax=Streptoalloteichus tenebrarius (strain ATCC 17920 / DSM 40477 / JCM 4838 / CBS 697.72 / NBRC 16177 / NCIMB 11028 / NRRL B-12390 / A12253. 1 / ISP 5477) TaxID=1933 RepID=A0ABT1HTL8_STRSD|nr:TetR/AcrR family transcriptional regulator [Streptoalloteichus tenebrarius]MCP2258833.1 transcriptional regulator, TetR family [Streptoalloteichus tenebrarius]